MTISPYTGSTNGVWLYAVISNPPEEVVSFEIQEYGQNSYQSCDKQNANAYLCPFDNGKVTEPLTVRINNNYYGIDIIESIEDWDASYPSASCSRGSAYTAENNGGSISATTIVAIVVSCLMVIAIITVGFFCLYRVQKNKGSASFENNKKNTVSTVGDVGGNAGGNDDTADVKGSDNNTAEIKMDGQE